VNVVYLYGEGATRSRDLIETIIVNSARELGDMPPWWEVSDAIDTRGWWYVWAARWIGDASRLLQELGAAPGAHLEPARVRAVVAQVLDSDEASG
jgi:hypothetical protein